jgi:hypothetical protein
VKVGRALWTSAGIMLLVAACGGKRAQNNPVPAQGGDAGHSGSDGGASARGGTGGEEPLGLPCFDDPLDRVPPCEQELERPVPDPRPVCPESEPQVGDSCTEAGLLCSYGEAATSSCRAYYQCSEGSWTLDTRLDPERYPCEPPAGHCPPEPPTLGDGCTPPPGYTPCVYEDVMCSCVAGNHWATSAEQWLCYGPPDDPSCPALLPNIGEGCSTQGVQCSYVEDCEFPPYSTVFCYDGAWEEGTRGTPCLP